MRVTTVNQKLRSSRTQSNHDRVKLDLIRGALLGVLIGQSLNSFYFYAPNLCMFHESTRALHAMSNLIGRCYMQVPTTSPSINHRARIR